MIRTLKHIPMAVLAMALCGGATAHDFKAGDLRIDHPYATPSRPGLKTGAVYFRGIKNNGEQGDRLLSARTPRAGKVEIHRMRTDGEVMRMRPVPALELPPKSDMPLRHSSHDGHHLMLLDLQQPLKDGERFPITLTFEHAGEREVMVWVQTPRSAGADKSHKH